MRCLTLMNYLQQQGWVTGFISLSLPPFLCEKVTERGHHLLWLNPSITVWNEDYDQQQTCLLLKTIKPTWLIVDHYQLSSSWEQVVAKYCNYLLVIDDLANREHQCHLLLDQGLDRQTAAYANLVNNDCQYLLGADYALLRPEFFFHRQKTSDNNLHKVINQNIHSILLSLGGSDQTETVSRLLRILEQTKLSDQCEITLVAGLSNIDQLSVLAQSSRLEVIIKPYIDDMIDVLLKMDLVIGAGGMSAWERCCLGVPSLLVVLAANQQENVTALVKRQAAIELPIADASDATIITLIDGFIAKPEQLRDLALNGQQLIDGGGLPRIATAMESLLLQEVGS